MFPPGGVDASGFNHLMQVGYTMETSPHFFQRNIMEHQTKSYLWVILIFPLVFCSADWVKGNLQKFPVIIFLNRIWHSCCRILEPHRSLSTVLVLELGNGSETDARSALQNGQPVQDLMRRKRRWKHELADCVAVALATLWLMGWLLVAQW
jgi:hypothetical protein